MVQNDMPIPSGNTQSVIQTALKGLWDKAQKAADLIKHLREENGVLKSRLEDLEQVVREQQVQITDKDNHAKEFQEKSAALSSVDVGDGLLYLSPDEREALERQIDDLIARINTHLGSDSR
jgi:hypothetical protein